MGNRDALDQSILFALDANCRTPLKRIASELGASYDSVRYRVRRLEREGVIWKYHASLDASALGFQCFDLFLRTRAATQRVLDEIVEHLCADSCVNWVATLEGYFQIAMAIRVTSVPELSTFFDRLNDKFGRYIVERDFHVVLGNTLFPRRHLTQDSSPEVKPKRDTNRSVAKFDRADLAILVSLKQDASKTVVEIREEIEHFGVTLSKEAVHKRLLRLERDGIITGYPLVMDISKLGMVHMKVFIQLNRGKGSLWKGLVSFFQSHPNVYYSLKLVGQWDYQFDFEVNSISHYREIFAEAEERFPRALLDSRGMVVVETHKYSASAAIAELPLLRES